MSTATKRTEQEHELASLYHHISNSGQTLTLIKKVTTTESEDREPRVSEHLFLDVSLAAFGIEQRTRIPLRTTMASIFREIANALEAQGNDGYSYLIRDQQADLKVDGREYDVGFDSENSKVTVVPHKVRESVISSLSDYLSSQGNQKLTPIQSKPQTQTKN